MSQRNVQFGLNRGILLSVPFREAKEWLVARVVSEGCRLILAIERDLESRSSSRPLGRHFWISLQRTPCLDPPFDIVDTTGFAELGEHGYVIFVGCGLA